METLTVEIRGEPLQTYLSGPKNNCLQQHKISQVWSLVVDPPHPHPQLPDSSIPLCEAVFVCPDCSTTILRAILGTERLRQECLPRSLAKQGRKKPSFGVVNSSDVPVFDCLGLMPWIQTWEPSARLLLLFLTFKVTFCHPHLVSGHISLAECFLNPSRKTQKRNLLLVFFPRLLFCFLIRLQLRNIMRAKSSKRTKRSFGGLSWERKVLFHH